MKFEELLSIYESKLSYVERMITPDNLEFNRKSSDYWNGYKEACFDQFQMMKMYLEDDIPRIRYKLTSEEKEKFDIKKEFPLCGIIDYRSQQIPVYNDDYGQSMFTEINGQSISGGTYNLFPEDEFEYAMDRYLDFSEKK